MHVFEKILSQNTTKTKILKEWTGSHIDFNFEKKKNSLKLIGRKANNDLVKYQLKGIKKTFLGMKG